MIKFQRRGMGCWYDCPDVKLDEYGYPEEIPMLEFEDEKELFEYVRETLPFTKNESDYKLRINDDVLVWWTVLGFIR